MTSARSSTRYRDQLPDARAHGDHGPAGPHPGAGPADAAASPRSASRTTRRSCGAWPTSSSTSSSATAGASSSAPTPSPSPCWWWPTSSGVPEEDHQRFREGFGLSRHRRRGRRRRGGQPGREPAGLARRLVHRVHRGPPTPAPRRRAHRSGAGHLPRRVHARRHLGGPHLDLPVRRRTGDHRPAAGLGAQVPGRAPRAAGRAASRPASSSPTSSRRCCGSRAR